MIDIVVYLFVFLSALALIVFGVLFVCLLIVLVTTFLAAMNEEEQ